MPSLVNSMNETWSLFLSWSMKTTLPSPFNAFLQSVLALFLNLTKKINNTYAKGRYTFERKQYEESVRPVFFKFVHWKH